MTTAQQQFVDLTERGQRAFTEAVSGWADSVRDYAGALTQVDLFDPTDTVHAVFDWAERTLKAQRELAANLLSAGTELAQTTRKATDEAAHRVTQAARRAADEVVGQAKAAAERITATDPAH